MRDVTIVITGCDRPDELEQTLKSLMQCDLSAIARFIVIEDSRNEQIEGIVSRCLQDFPYLFLQNEQNMGQIYSVDRAYAEIDTPYIFHCEEDWVFPSSLFIEPSKSILTARPDIHAVMLRDPSEVPQVQLRVIDRELEGLEYWEFDTKSDRRAGSFSFNPGLRRLSDYKAHGPYAGIGPERIISFHHKLLGFKLAHLKQGDVQHIGFEPTVKTDDIAFRKSAKYYLVSLRDQLRFLKYRVFR